MKKSLLMGALLAVLAFNAPPARAAETVLEIYNASNNPVKVFLTLNPAPSPNPGYVQNVQGLPWRHPVTMNTINTLQGWFKLRNGDTARLELPQGQALNAKVTFDQAPAANVTVGNIRLNNTSPAFAPDQNETAGIDITGGVNSKIQFDLTPAWGAGSISQFWNTKTEVNPVAGVARVTSGGIAKVSFLRFLN